MDIFKDIIDQIQLVFSKGVLGIGLIDLGLIVLATIFAIIIRSLFAKIVVKKIKAVVSKTGNSMDDALFDALIPPLKLVPIVLVFLFITLFTEIDSTLGIYLQKINNTLSTVFIFWLIHQALFPLSSLFKSLEKVFSKAQVQWLTKSIKYLVIFLGLVAVLEVLGIKIGPVIAGLGLFGVAVALGAQDLFKNLISGIMILLEKRFEIGDVIDVTGHTEGTVEHIGFRSTLIRKFDSTPISIPNHIFAEVPVINLTDRKYRRINWIIGLEYSSTSKQLKEITSLIRSFIESSPDFVVNEDYTLMVRVDKFNDSSIDIIIYGFTNTNNWKEFLKIKEDLAIKIKEIVEDNDCNFAFPSRTIYSDK